MRWGGRDVRQAVCGLRDQPGRSRALKDDGLGWPQRYPQCQSRPRDICSLSTGVQDPFFALSSPKLVSTARWKQRAEWCSLELLNDNGGAADVFEKLQHIPCINQHADDGQRPGAKASNQGAEAPSRGWLDCWLVGGELAYPQKFSARLFSVCTGALQGIRAGPSMATGRHTLC